MSYLDKTFCLSPNCANKCGRKMTQEEKDNMPDNSLIWYAYFCGCPDKADRFSTNTVGKSLRLVKMV